MLIKTQLKRAKLHIAGGDVEALVAAFYDKLFATHPEVREMFADDMSQIVSLSNILK